MNKTPDMPHPAWQYYWNVDAIDAAVQRINTEGGKVIMGHTRYRAARGLSTHKTHRAVSLRS